MHVWSFSRGGPWGRGCILLSWSTTQKHSGWWDKVSPHVRESTKVLDSGSQPLDSRSQHLDSGFQPFGFRIPAFWIPDSIPKRWFRIPSHCGFRIPVSGFRIPTGKKLLDSGFRILLHGAKGWNTDVYLVFWIVSDTWLRDKQCEEPIPPGLRFAFID